MIVIENPTQFTMVRAVPFNSAKVLLAIKVENKGESAITTVPQNNRNPINARLESILKNNGETKQHIQDKSNAKNAILLVPKCWDK